MHIKKAGKLRLSVLGGRSHAGIVAEPAPPRAPPHEQAAATRRKGVDKEVTRSLGSPSL